jgi:choline dehydrogenase-like flavoprotein
MATTTVPQRTDFSLDVLGRYACNGWDEALASTDVNQSPGARPFDAVVIGGGSFGAVLATHLFHSDRTHRHRVLVLEAGALSLPEHVQNLPPPIDVADVWSKDVWNSDSPQTYNQSFAGLAFTVGGRSLFWGGWSPYFIASEIDSPMWPASVRRDLTTGVLNVGGLKISYLDHAADQIGVKDTNDFVHGDLHTVLRARLFRAIKSRPANAKPLLAGSRGTVINAQTRPEVIEELEAPLAVQSKSPRAGFFPFNKFNAAQLLLRAARLAQSEAESTTDPNLGLGAANVNKRLMIVDQVHVIRLEMDPLQPRRVLRVHTNQGVLEIPPDGKVFLALGTIENTRLALATLPNQNKLMGTNLMAHLRTNITVRIRRADLNEQALEGLSELQASALFVKGIHEFQNIADGVQKGHFHVQITGAGTGQLNTNSEAELFKKIPNIDELDRFSDLNDKWIILTFRGIGEMFGNRVPVTPPNRVTLDPDLARTQLFDYGQKRALVSIDAGPPNGKHLELWRVMDQACLDLAGLVADGAYMEFLNTDVNRTSQWWAATPPPVEAGRDTLGSTHHEGGTLFMGEDPARSVTDEFGKLWESDNLYALGPCLLPTMGSPNPMLSGVALSRRTADHILAGAGAGGGPIAPQAPRPQLFPEVDFSQVLFDGTESTFNLWQNVGASSFTLLDGQLVAQPGTDMGLLYYAAANFDDFILRLEFLLPRPAGAGNDNSGVFFGFRNPRQPVVRRNDPARSDLYENKPWVAVRTGFEVQIDEEARNDGENKHRTGAIYDIPTAPTVGFDSQDYRNGLPITAGEWNTFEIQYINRKVAVFLNGRLVTSFSNTDGYRGRGKTQDPSSGFIGVQSHTGLVRFRNIRVKAANLPAQPQTA